MLQVQVKQQLNYDYNKIMLKVLKNPPLYTKSFTSNRDYKIHLPNELHV